MHEKSIYGWRLTVNVLKKSKLILCIMDRHPLAFTVVNFQMQ